MIKTFFLMPWSGEKNGTSWNVLSIQGSSEAMPIPAPRSKCFRLHLKSEAKTSTTLVKICVFMCFYGAFTINITIYHEFMASNEDQNCWMAPFFGPTKPHESFLHCNCSTIWDLDDRNPTKGSANRTVVLPPRCASVSWQVTSQERSVGQGVWEWKILKNIENKVWSCEDVSFSVHISQQKSCGQTTLSRPRGNVCSGVIGADRLRVE